MGKPAEGGISLLKLHYDPAVYLAHRPALVDRSPHAPAVGDFLKDHAAAYDPHARGAASDAEKIPELAGRLCYMSFERPRPGGNRAYLEHILQTAHGSVLEHASWGFIFTGVSRSLTHELVRHRAGFAYSQLSQRYVDEGDCEAVVPHDLRREVRAAEEWLAPRLDGPGAGRPGGDFPAASALAAARADCPDPFVLAGLTWLEQVLAATDAYRKQVEYLAGRAGRGGSAPCDGQRTAVRKAARGAARSLLPNATETKIFVTANARAFRHLLEMRAAAPAEAEIRKLSYLVWKVLVCEAPGLFGDFVPEELPDGTTALRATHRKV